METIELFVKIKVDTFQELGLWVARCAALRLSANGKTPDEAAANLHEVIAQFLVSCVERGNILEVLRANAEQQTMAKESESPQEMTIPIPLLANAHAGRQAH